MPKVIPPKSRATSAKIWVAPEPKPPPKEAIKIIISWSFKIPLNLSLACSAAFFANSGFAPVPKPRVKFSPNQKYFVPGLFFKALISVSAITKLAFSKDLPISETIDPPPPPIPITLIFALKNDPDGKAETPLSGNFFLGSDLLIFLIIFFVFFALAFFLTFFFKIALFIFGFLLATIFFLRLGVIFFFAFRFSLFIFFLTKTFFTDFTAFFFIKTFLLITLDLLVFLALFFAFAINLS